MQFEVIEANCTYYIVTDLMETHIHLLEYIRYNVKQIQLFPSKERQRIYLAIWPSGDTSELVQ